MVTPPPCFNMCPKCGFVHKLGTSQTACWNGIRTLGAIFFNTPIFQNIYIYMCVLSIFSYGFVVTTSMVPAQVTSSRFRQQRRGIHRRRRRTAEGSTVDDQLLQAPRGVAALLTEGHQGWTLAGNLQLILGKWRKTWIQPQEIYENGENLGKKPWDVENLDCCCFCCPFFVEKLPTFQLIWIIQVWRLGHVPEPLSNKICVASWFHPIRIHKEGSISSRNIQFFFFNPLQLGV